MGGGGITITGGGRVTLIITGSGGEIATTGGGRVTLLNSVQK